MALNDRQRKIVKDIQKNDTAAAVYDRIKNGTITRDDFLTFAKECRDVLNLGTVRELMRLSPNTVRKYMLDCGIEEGYIEMLEQTEPIDPADGADFKNIKQVQKGYTEVYFWGMPASGKTCALGAVLSVAKNGNYTMTTHPCQGGDYMNRLSGVFRHNGCYTRLPRGTNILSIYEMCFNLRAGNWNYPLAFFDLSGELFTCMYKSYNNVALGEDENAALTTINSILVDKKSENRKMHFFVIEYGGENQRFSGLTPDMYLQRAAEYLENKHVFDKYTDAVYIVLTKADRAGTFDTSKAESDHFKNYMRRCYGNFYEALRDMCKKHSINDGNLIFVPFTIGEIMFGSLCHFDSNSANEILEYILDRAAKNKAGFRGCLGNFMRQ